MSLNSKKLRLVLLAGLAASVILFFVVAILGVSALSAESKKMVDLKVKSETADLQLSNLEQSKKEIEKYGYFKTVARTVIPTDKNQAQTVLDIFQIADEVGISIQSLTFPNSTLGLAPATTPTPATTTTTQDATSAAATQKAISQAVPVADIPGVYSLALNILPSSDRNTPPDKQITYPKMLDFLRRIENNRRTAQAVQITINPSGANQVLSFTLSINIFIKP